MKRIAALLLLLAALPASADEELDAAFDRDVLVVVASRHACHRFDIYLAITNDQQRRGLMFVRELPQTTGMLFVYNEDAPHSMWMKNTFIPLDIAFIRSDGSIANIAKSTEPQSLRSIRSAGPVSYVLELNAGVTDRLLIDTESRVLWGPVFVTEADDEATP